MREKQDIGELDYDVVVIGGGSAGIAAAIAAAKNGAKTILIESNAMVGSDLISGLPIDGCLNSRGDWIVGGIARELFEECARLRGYFGHFYDWRRIWVVCIDPEIMKIALVRVLDRYGVTTLLYTLAMEVEARDGSISPVLVVNKTRKTLISGKIFVDCTGDGDIAVRSGAPFEMGGSRGELQPLGMVFRMSNVDATSLLEFVNEHPENVSLAENPLVKKSRRECAEDLLRQGYPKVYFIASGPLLSQAIESGEMYPCHMISIIPVSAARKEVSINSTRLSGVNASDIEQLSLSLSPLMDQVVTCATFLNKRVPGFEDSWISGVAPKIGIRETRRIMGEYVLSREDIIKGRASEKSIAMGGHPLDIHGKGTEHEMIQLEGGGSYGIPYGCLIPKNVDNLLMAGRCLSSTREANSSARVMGTCMATGHAAGAAAAICVASGIQPRQLSVEGLRETLKAQGAVID
jgi:hypothetical protein